MSLLLSAILGSHPSRWEVQFNSGSCRGCGHPEPGTLWEPLRGVLDTLCNLVSPQRGHNSHAHVQQGQAVSLSRIPLIHPSRTAALVLPASSCSCPGATAAVQAAATRLLYFPGNTRTAPAYGKACERCLSVKGMNIPEPAAAPGTADHQVPPRRLLLLSSPPSQPLQALISCRICSQAPGGDLAPTLPSEELCLVPHLS